MSPVLEERCLALQQACQLRLAVGLIAAEEDVVMGALDSIDTVDLDVAQVLDQPQQPVIIQLAHRICRQALGLEQQAPCRGIGYHEKRSGGGGHDSAGLPAEKAARIEERDASPPAPPVATVSA